MDLIEALILGIVQGLTEFLPVSSSGHIEIAKVLLDIEIKEALLFTVVLHLATAFSTIIVYRMDLLGILKGWLSKGWNDEKKFALLVILSMIPATIIGLFLEDQIEEFFSGNMLLVGLMLVLTGIILLVSDKVKKVGNSQLTYRQSALLGIVQAIAILPGISRSGSTIASGVLFGLKRDVAAKFSFIMVLPLILGASAKKMMEFQEVGASNGELPVTALLVGFLAAFISGLLALRWMIRLVQKSQLKWFAFYCFIVGCIAVIHDIIS